MSKLMQTPPNKKTKQSTNSTAPSMFQSIVAEEDNLQLMHRQADKIDQNWKSTNNMNCDHELFDSGNALGHPLSGDNELTMR